MSGIFGWFNSLFSKIGYFFTSPKAQTLEQQIAKLTQQALPIIQAIAMLVPNKTLQEVINAYQIYGVPITNSIANDPTSIGNAMLNLGTTVLSKSSPTTSSSILNTAIQFAVVLNKNK